MAVIGAPAYCVMFGPGPPGPQQTAARERFRRTTLAYMGCRSLQAAAKEMGIRFVGAHTRAIYSRLVTGDRDALSIGEAHAAFEWGDWAALCPSFWLGATRIGGEPEKDMMFTQQYARDWPYRFMAAMADIYGWEKLAATGLFLDADVLEWWDSLKRFADIAELEGVPLYLNGGQFRDFDPVNLKRFNGLFYEAVHVGAAWEAESRENAERLLVHTKDLADFWTGVQVRFQAEPTTQELQQWSEWFLRTRQSPNQSLTFVVQPQGAQPRELPCPDALDPARFVQAKPVGGTPRSAPPAEEA